MYLLFFVCLYILCKCIYLCIYGFLYVCAAGSGVGADVTLAQKIRDPAGKNTEIFFGYIWFFCKCIGRICIALFVLFYGVTLA